MTISHKYLHRTLAAALLSALLTPGAALAARQTYTAPKFPVPASARVHPSTGGTAGVPFGTGKATTPAGATATGGVLPTATSTVPRTTATTPTFTATTPPPAATSTPFEATRAGTSKPAAASKQGSSRISTPALLLAVLAALVALACAIWGVARMQAFEPRWTLSLRHTIAEAGFRASATWAEFSDWARLGR